MNPTGVEHITLPGPRSMLSEHHREIDVACMSLRAAACADDPLDVIAKYRALEHAVNEHMAAEEEVILQTYATIAPVDAAAIRDTHQQLRQLLYQLGIEAELHCIRLEAVDQLIATLRAHAAHEDREMYPWAQMALPPNNQRALVARIGSSLQELATRRLQR
jgi:hypothetical protein